MHIGRLIFGIFMLFIGLIFLLATGAVSGDKTKDEPIRKAGTAWGVLMTGASWAIGGWALWSA